MESNEKISKEIPRDDVEAVVLGVVDPDENHDESLDRALLLLSHDLSRTVPLDVTVLSDIAELPRPTAAGLHLDRNMSSRFIGCEDIEVRNVARERCRDQSATAEFGGNEVLACLAYQFAVSTPSHNVQVSARTVTAFSRVHQTDRMGLA